MRLKSAVFFSFILLAVGTTFLVYTQGISGLSRRPYLHALRTRLSPFLSISISSGSETVSSGKADIFSSRVFSTGSGNRSVSATSQKVGSDHVSDQNGGQPSANHKSAKSITTATTTPQNTKLRAVLKWAGAPLQRGQPQWQRLDRDLGAFVYSAHFDFIVFPPVVRIIGIAQQVLPFQNVTCRFYYHDDDNDSHHAPSMHGVSVSGTLYHFRGKNGRNYIGAFVDCPLSNSSVNVLPFAVSVNKGNDSLVTNYMIIHRDDKNKKYYSGTLTAFHNGYDKHKFLAEMVSASLAMGVNRFVFYVLRAGPNVLRMLQVLEQKGVAEVYPWNIHLPGKDLFYAAQFSAIQDCLYRHMTSSRFLLFGDVDELFVPRRQRTLLPLLDNAFQKTPECGAYLFRNVFFDLNLPSNAVPLKVDPSRFAQTHALSTLNHVLRQAQPLPAGSRSKPALDPRKIFTGSVHVIGKFRQGFHSCTMAPNLGLLYHYRFVKGDNGPLNDTYLWNYAPAIIREMTVLLRHFNKTVSKPYP